MGMYGQHGLTLAELMITMAILAILVSLGAIGFRELVLNNRREAYLNDFSSAVALARSESIKRGRRVGLCATDDAGVSCAGNTTDAYHQGWVVFSDTDGTFGLDGIFGTFNLGGTFVPTNTAALTCAETEASGMDDVDCLVKTYPPINGSGRFLVGTTMAAWTERVIYLRSTGEVYFREGAVLQQNAPVRFVYCDPRGQGTDDRVVTVGPGLAVVESVPGGAPRPGEC